VTTSLTRQALLRRSMFRLSAQLQNHFVDRFLGFVASLRLISLQSGQKIGRHFTSALQPLLLLRTSPRPKLTKVSFFELSICSPMRRLSSSCNSLNDVRPFRAPGETPELS